MLDLRVLSLLGQQLNQQYVRTRIEGAEQEAIFKSFCEGLASANVTEWTNQAVAFEKDPTGPDPYYRETAGTPASLIPSNLRSAETSYRHDRSGYSPPAGRGR